MKKVILSVIIIIGLICGCSPKESEPRKNIEMILDVQQYCGISEAELIEKMGEPESREEWTYEVGDLYSPIVSCFYNNNEFEFMLNSNKVQRISIPVSYTHLDVYKRQGFVPISIRNPLILRMVQPSNLKSGCISIYF